MRDMNCVTSDGLLAPSCHVMMKRNSHEQTKNMRIRLRVLTSVKSMNGKAGKTSKETDRDLNSLANLMRKIHIDFLSLIALIGEVSPPLECFPLFLQLLRFLLLLLLD